MRDRAVIVEGVASDASADALYSTVHGAGRVMSRTVAAGKFQGFGRKRRLVRPGKVDFEECRRDVAAHGVELRGGGADEAPECYKSLADVLTFHGRTVRVLHELRPIGVAMAGSEAFDPFRD
jgi:tRNA-splicing ligase RtcB